ncbi:general odorant-binding protein 56d-like [Contarinia nasturtii]|uniref:general odorant-binding protein 56d-like n=1 Tax=Contarinia nasturtii TaxID=265458 RepID=UPI0012D3D082|nr:general odorant-binding protein 56d-like [Contarinia nasturtii]
MRVTLVLLTVLGISLAALDIPEHMRAGTKQLRKACVAETGIDVKHIDASKNGHLENVPEMGCYINCLLEHAGMIDTDGSIHWRDVWHFLTPSIQETVKIVVAECETKHGENKCETAFQTIDCYYKTQPEGAELP